MSSPTTRKLTSPRQNLDRTVVRVRTSHAISGGAVSPVMIEFGGRAVPIIAGPCSVENGPMLLEVAHAVRAAGGSMLRGGAYKPRTSPYEFQGLGHEALELLAEARAATGLPVVTEILDPRDVELVARHADMFQIGARNMQNYALLAEVGRAAKPVFLKRGFSATIAELLMAAEHVMSRGNANVILCERGIRTFETKTRNTLDLSAVPVLKAETHLPVVVDPSHGGGRADLVAPLSFAAIAAGADGLMIEVHPDPATALSDGQQSLPISAFMDLMIRLAPFAAAAGRGLSMPNTSDDAPDGDIGQPIGGDGVIPYEVPDALARIRREIERVDRDIIALVGDRVRLAREAGHEKRRAGIPIIDPHQESQVLSRGPGLAQLAELPMSELRLLQQHLIAIARRAQAPDLYPSEDEE
jgi:3-deoxy-7-phosphoheptulonate synthase